MGGGDSFAKSAMQPGVFGAVRPDLDQAVDAVGAAVAEDQAVCRS
jgi:hypothetical protein